MPIYEYKAPPAHHRRGSRAARSALRTLAALFCMLLLSLCLSVPFAHAVPVLGTVIITPDGTIVIPDDPLPSACLPDSFPTIVIPWQYGQSLPVADSPAPEPSGPAAVILPDETQVVTPDPDAALPSELPYRHLIAELFALTNEARRENGVPELTYNTALQAVADLRAEEASQKFSHTRPDGSSCHSVVENFDYIVTGENLILADSSIASAERLMREWLESEGHRHNILLGDFTSVAIGVTEHDGTVFAAQVFLG